MRAALAAAPAAVARAQVRQPERRGSGQDCGRPRGATTKLVSYGPLANIEAKDPCEGVTHTNTELNQSWLTQEAGTCGPKTSRFVPSNRKSRAMARATAATDVSPLDTTSAWRQTSACCVEVRVLYTSKPVWKSKFYGAFVLNHRVGLHAIDATPA